MIRNEGKHLEFGKGDIGIHMGDTSDAALLLFRNLDTPAPIGKLLNRQRRREVEILDLDVVMSFSNAESIDALIKCLKVIRQNLVEVHELYSAHDAETLWSTNYKITPSASELLLMKANMAGHFT